MSASDTPTSAIDDQLVRRIRAGDAAAFEQLVDRHSGRLYAIAFNMTLKSADAEDLVQETFMAAFEGFAGFGRKATVKTWLTRIMLKRIARHFRRQKIRKTLPIDDQSLSNHASDERISLKMDCQKALAQLDFPFRQVVVLRELEGLSYQEIARVLHIPRGTVESRLYRARAKLRQLLADYVPDNLTHTGDRSTP